MAAFRKQRPVGDAIGTELDGVVNEVIEYAAQHDIPITNHHSPGGTPPNGFLIPPKFQFCKIWCDQYFEIHFLRDKISVFTGNLEAARNNRGCDDRPYLRLLPWMPLLQGILTSPRAKNLRFNISQKCKTRTKEMAQRNRTNYRFRRNMCLIPAPITPSGWPGLRSQKLRISASMWRAQRRRRSGGVYLRESPNCG
jgi:hypothetical protein